MTSAAAAFRHEGGRTACLLLHGFTATPEEMRYLGTRLHERGFTVLAPCVAAHGTHPEDLARSSWQDWYASAEQSLRELIPTTDRLVVVGQSMGALLALRLAARHPQHVGGVALLAPAIRLSRWWLSWVRPLLPLLARRQPYHEKADSGDIADEAARAVRLGYRQIPVRALHQLLLLQKEVRSLLAEVRQPCLIIQSRQDHTCSASGVTVLQQRLGGPVETLMLDDSFHVVSVDVDRELVADQVARFAAAGSTAATTDTGPRDLPAF